MRDSRLPVVSVYYIGLLQTFLSCDRMNAPCYCFIYNGIWTKYGTLHGETSVPSTNRARNPKTAARAGNRATAVTAAADSRERDPHR